MRVWRATPTAADFTENDMKMKQWAPAVLAIVLGGAVTIIGAPATAEAGASMRTFDTNWMQIESAWAP